MGFQKPGIGSSGYYKGYGFSTSLSGKVHSVLRKNHNFSTAKKLHGIVNAAMNVALEGGRGRAKGRVTAPEFEAVVNVLKGTQHNKIGVKFTDHDIAGIQDLFAKHIEKKNEYTGNPSIFVKKEGISEAQYRRRSVTKPSMQGEMRSVFGDRRAKDREATGGLVDDLIRVTTAADKHWLERDEAHVITDQLAKGGIISEKEAKKMRTVFDRRLGGRTRRTAQANTGIDTGSPIRKSVLSKRDTESRIGKSRMSGNNSGVSPTSPHVPTTPPPAPAPNQASFVRRPLP